MDEYNETPEKDIKSHYPQGKPRFMSKVIPSNITTPRFIEMLEDMQHSGVLMFETECDAILKKMKSEHGEYTDIFRKAFTHESIQKLIKQDDSFNHVENPKLSVLVSGTPNQPKRFFGYGGNAENGTLQRFMFYVFDKASLFLSKWGCNGENESDLPKEMANLSKEIDEMSRRPLMELEITEQQSKKFEQFWQSIERKYKKIYGDDVISVTRRLSMSFTRIAMILQRMVSHTELLEQSYDTKPEDYIGDKVVLSDKNFMLTCDIMNVIINHTFVVWEFVTGKKPNEEDSKGSANTQKSKFIYSIEEAINNKIETGFEFTIKTAEIKEIASDLDIKWRTAQRYIKEFISNGLIEKSGHGEYELKNKDDD